MRARFRDNSRFGAPRDLRIRVPGRRKRDDSEDSDSESEDGGLSSPDSPSPVVQAFSSSVAAPMVGSVAAPMVTTAPALAVMPPAPMATTVLVLSTSASNAIVTTEIDSPDTPKFSTETDSPDTTTFAAVLNPAQTADLDITSSTQTQPPAVSSTSTESEPPSPTTTTNPAPTGSTVVQSTAATTRAGSASATQQPLDAVAPSRASSSSVASAGAAKANNAADGQLGPVVIPQGGPSTSMRVGIAMGVLGAVSIIAAIILVVLKARKKKKANKTNEASYDAGDPFGDATMTRDGGPKSNSKVLDELIVAAYAAEAGVGGNVYSQAPGQGLASMQAYNSQGAVSDDKNRESDIDDYYRQAGTEAVAVPEPIAQPAPARPRRAISRWISDLPRMSVMSRFTTSSGLLTPGLPRMAHPRGPFDDTPPGSVRNGDSRRMEDEMTSTEATSEDSYWNQKPDQSGGINWALSKAKNAKWWNTGQQQP